ncbi:MAG: ParB/RepB/Spo0J family partition protein [Lachnospiraceae bacterium]|nr:ParB/RepB/Spo0J family partition protein [Lachnospiraceae bacterium]
MSKIDLSKVSMSGFDDIFANNTDEIPAIMVALTELHEFTGHPFRVIDDQLADLIESIKENGVLEPGIVRPRKKGGYEIISGHRRRRACELAGLKEMPVRVMDYSDDEATIVMVDTNIHRENILPSEKAYSYVMKFEALKHQGKGGGRTLEALSESAGDGEKTIQRYIWLSRLNNDLMELVDGGMMPLMAGVELSFLTKEYQEWVVDVLSDNHIEKITLAQAAAIRAKAKEMGNTFYVSDIIQILMPAKKEKPKKFRFRQNRITDYFPPDTDSEKIEDTIYELLEVWQKHKKHALFLDINAKQEQPEIQIPGQINLEDFVADGQADSQG